MAEKSYRLPPLPPTSQEINASSVGVLDAQMYFISIHKEGRMKGRKEGWKDGRKDGRMEGRKDGTKEGRPSRFIFSC